MEEFNTVSSCDICGEQETLCKEEIVITKDGRQKVETWCKKCYKQVKQEALEEMAMQNEEAMHEVYKYIIRSSY